MRLIDADALIEDIREHSASYFADDFAHEWVDQQPTIEPERKKGKWITPRLVYSDFTIATCSVCGERIPVGRFCINCGADMRKEN